MPDPLVTIGRQILEVDIHGTEADGLALHRRLPRVCADVVSPAIESALGGVCPVADHLSIEQLQVDLAISSLDRLEGDLGPAVQRAIEDLIRRLPALAGAASVAGVAEAAGAASGVRRRTAAATVDDALIAFLRTGRLPWSFRLTSGSRLETVVLEAWATSGRHRGPPPESLDRLGQVLDNGRARARLRLQFSPILRLAVLSGLAPGLAGAVEEIQDAVEEAPGTIATSAAGRAFLERVWEVAFDAARSGNPTDAAALIRSAWAELPAAERAHSTAAALKARWPDALTRPRAAPGRDETHRAVEEIRRAVEEPVGPAVAPTAGRAFLERVWEAALDAARSGGPADAAALIRRAWAGLPAVERDDSTAAALDRRWPGALGRPSAVPGSDDPRSPDLPQATQPTSEPAGAGSPTLAKTGDAPPPRRPSDPAHRLVEPRAHLASVPGGPDTPTRGRAFGRVPAGPAPDLTDEPGGILADNAGMVLLHPFLPRFLEGLGVATGHGLTDPARGVCLLHHVATGEHTVPEHQTTLAKVLCELPLDEPVEADPGLTAAEMEEASALLEAVVGHWEVLRNTSPAALRGEFLTRPGVLTMDSAGDWLLRVETRTVDILLDQLPWGISLLKLPWMSRRMMVEWR